MITNPNCFTKIVSEQKYQVNAKNFILMETCYIPHYLRKKNEYILIQPVCH